MIFFISVMVFCCVFLWEIFLLCVLFFIVWVIVFEVSSLLNRFWWVGRCGLIVVRCWWVKCICVMWVSFCVMILLVLCLLVMWCNEMDGENWIKLLWFSQEMVKNFCMLFSICKGGFFFFFLWFGVWLNIMEMGIICMFKVGLFWCRLR